MRQLTLLPMLGRWGSIHGENFISGYNYEVCTTQQPGRRFDTMTQEPNTLRMTQYQVFEPLSEEAYTALKMDIAKHGIRVPVEVDEEGNILDGHNRAAIAEELGIDCPQVVRTFATEAEKIEYAVKANLLRRHVGPLQWARAFQKLMEVRHMRRKAKHNRHTPTAATIAGLAEEVGVKERTARDRLQLFEELEVYPDLMQQVDAGELTAKAARREKNKRVSKAQDAPQGLTQENSTMETPVAAEETLTTPSRKKPSLFPVPGAMGFLEQVKEYAYKQLDKYEEQDILFSTYGEKDGQVVLTLAIKV